MVNAKPAGLPLKATKVMRPHLRDGGEEDPDRLAGRSDMEGEDSLWSSHLSLLPLQADVRVADHGVRRMAGGRSVASHSQLMAIITRCKQSCV